VKFYAVLDTNVLVSAMLRLGSVPGQVAAEAMNGDIIPVLNDEILEEYEDVLRRPKFGFDERAVKVFWMNSKDALYMWMQGLLKILYPIPKILCFMLF